MSKGLTAADLAFAAESLSQLRWILASANLAIGARHETYKACARLAAVADKLKGLGHALEAEQAQKRGIMTPPVD